VKTTTNCHARSCRANDPLPPTNTSSASSRGY
jgi:hypothetical protein